MKKKLIFVSFLSNLFLPGFSQETTKSKFVQTAEALSSLAWPLIALIIFCVLFPHIKNIVKSRNFSIKVAGMELNVQNMADQLSEQIHQLQNKTIELACQIEDNANAKEAMKRETTAVKKQWRVLWVTGKHESHAFEIGYLEKDGVEVIKAHSTAEAMEILSAQAAIIDAVVTGVGRKEKEISNPQAGLDLLKKVKQAGITVPVFIMCSEKSIKEYYQKLLDEGAIQATSSSLDLLAFLKGAGINCKRQAVITSDKGLTTLSRTSAERILS